MADGVEPEVNGSRERLESVENAAPVKELLDPRALGCGPLERIDGDDRISIERLKDVLERRRPGKGRRDDRPRPDVYGEERDEGADDDARRRGRTEMTRGGCERENDAGGDREGEPLIPAEEAPHRGKDGNVCEKPPGAGKKRPAEKMDRRAEGEKERRGGESSPQADVGFGASGIESQRDGAVDARQEKPEPPTVRANSPGKKPGEPGGKPGRSPSKTALRGTENPEW